MPQRLLNFSILIPLISLIVAIWLEVLPYPAGLVSFIPPWSSLMVIFWCAWAPQPVRIGYAWGYGLVLDMLLFTPLGMHALGKALLALLATEFQERFWVYGLTQQCLLVLVLCLLERMLIFGIYQISGAQPEIADYWPSAVAAAILWPLCLLILRPSLTKRDTP